MLTRVVPDLVFSEMRFLQKPESVSREEPGSKSKRKSKKKKPRHTFEKEISRYFDAGEIRPHDDERDQKRHTPSHDTAAAEVEKKGLQSVSPVVSDLLEKPFLGFGSRGTHPPTTSYYSWSESGREGSARSKHFAPDLELLAAGQLQSSRPRKQRESILLDNYEAERPSAEPAVTEQHNKNQGVISEHARDIDQATRPAAKPGPIQQPKPKEPPVPISDEHQTSVPAATSLANQSEARLNSTEKDSKVPGPALNAPQNNDDHNARPVRLRPARNRVLRQNSEPWEELLQNCELAARPPMPTHHDESFARYRVTAPLDQRAPAAYDHADLRLWRADIADLPEPDYLDNTAFVNEHVDWAQPEAMEYQGNSGPFFEETMDDDSESQDSENGCSLPQENRVGWEEGDAKQYDAMSDYQVQDGEAMNGLAMFWQPNKLY